MKALLSKVTDSILSLLSFIHRLPSIAIVYAVTAARIDYCKSRAALIYDYSMHGANTNRVAFWQWCSCAMNKPVLRIDNSPYGPFWCGLSIMRSSISPW